MIKLFEQFTDFEDFSEDEIFGKKEENIKDLFLIKTGKNTYYVAQKNSNKRELYIFEHFGPINNDILNYEIVEKSSMKDGVSHVSYWIKDDFQPHFFNAYWEDLPQEIKNRIE